MSSDADGKHQSSIEDCNKYLSRSIPSDFPSLTFSDFYQCRKQQQQQTKVLLDTHCPWYLSNPLIYLLLNVTSVKYVVLTSLSCSKIVLKLLFLAVPPYSYPLNSIKVFLIPINTPCHGVFFPLYTSSLEMTCLWKEHCHAAH